MKKFLTLLLLYSSLVMPASAVITLDELNNQDYIKNRGYSEEMARLVNLQNAQVNGTKNTYKSNEPSWYSDKKVQFVRNIFTYIDCGLDDGRFMQDNINFTTRWNDI